jgi:hypothetical protein
MHQTVDSGMRGARHSDYKRGLLIVDFDFASTEAGFWAKGQSKASCAPQNS